MTRRTVRRLGWVGVALCAVALAFGVTERVLEPPPGFTESNLRRIRKGMTLAHVEAILGRPADEQGTGVFTDGRGGVFVTRTWRVEVFDADVWFTQAGGHVHDVFRGVGGGAGVSVDEEEPRPLGRLRALFGW